MEGLKDGDITEAAPPPYEPVATEWHERVWNVLIEGSTLLGTDEEQFQL